MLYKLLLIINWILRFILWLHNRSATQNSIRSARLATLCPRKDEASGKSGQTQNPRYVIPAYRSSFRMSRAKGTLPLLKELMSDKFGAIMSRCLELKLCSTINL